MSADTIERGEIATTKVDGRLPANPKLFGQYLQNPGRRAAISAVAASFMDPEKVVKVVLRCVAMTPQLQQCTMDSVFRAVLMASELGLEVGSALGEAYLVPYKQTCQMIPGYRGLVALARRSGQVDDVYARAVFQGDEFEVSLGTEEYIKHVPKFGERSPNGMTYVYAVAKMHGGGNHFDIMTKPEVDAIRGRSPAGRSGPWVSDYIEMAKKTIVRRMCKMLPLSVEMAKALTLQDAVDTGDYSHVDFDCIDGDEVKEIESVKEAPEQAEDSTRGAGALKDKLKNGNGHAAPEAPKGLTDEDKAAILAEERRAAEASTAKGDLDLDMPTTTASAQTRGAMDR